MNRVNLELVVGPESYYPETYACVQNAGRATVQRAKKAPAADAAFEGAIPETRSGFSELYTNKHEKLLLRLDHVERMDSVRRAFNKSRTHPGQRAMTTSDLVTACLDFVLQHRIPFHALTDADELGKLIGEHVYRDALSRWRQWNETF